MATGFEIFVQMTLASIANLVGVGLASISAFVVIYMQFRRPITLQDKFSVVKFGGLWAAILLFEFYALGPASYISMNIDGNLGISFYKFLADQHLGGQIAHGYGGGHDVGAMTGFGTQFFSLEQIFSAIFPTWVTIFLLKLAVALTGFIGAYKLCRITGPTDRTVSAGLAILFTVSIPYNINASTWNGLGYSVLPWVIYLGVARANKQHYILGLFCLGILTSTTEPLHTFLAIAGTAVAAPIMLGKINFRTLFLPLIFILTFMFANWFEVFYALKQIAPTSIRGVINFKQPNLIEALVGAFTQFYLLKVGAIGIIVSMGVLAYLRHSYIWKAVGAVAVLIISYVALALIPWADIGLGVVSGLSPHYLFYATTALMLPLISRTINIVDFQTRNGSSGIAHELKWPMALIFGTAVAMLVLFKVENFSNFIYYGGQSQFHTIENLKERAWAPSEPFRVVTLRHYRPEPEIPSAFYGLDTYDAALSLTPAPYSIYWRDGILKGKGTEGFFGRLTLDREYFTKNSYDIERQADLNLLRAANVRFILSPIPLTGNLDLVSGPDSPPLRPSDGILAFVKDRVTKILRYGKIYVYSLTNSLPRIFAASQVRAINSAATDIEFLKVVSDVALSKIAVIRQNTKSVLRSKDPALINVEAISKIVSGYRAKISAPNGGILVLNVPPSKFWRAFDSNEKELRLFDVNMVQMGVAVSAGTQSVTYRYSRPTVRAQIKLLNGL